ncbi:MAG TPA: hypothetical protein PKB03_06820, partial [Baekduia sp.]|nr:hypothetical protein [Baekduia sp.]
MASWFGKGKGEPEDVDRPRTPEEREAAYQERLRRRTGEIDAIPQEAAFNRLDLEADGPEPEPEVKPEPEPERLAAKVTTEGPNAAS